ncbi:PREDICTED: paramyosin, short form-like [Eufriesea mexicana]|uniref:paramyosin, short form-like n=1 Tax=Eufriesea mexicana TaxID=516756 RepID=UPI00083C64CF|nr:PREDICTED: paramyosin, short form-like [Eufriesea mexicana]XP_017758960.1 PREDICTED: paramyosin, short form-like [Eufriesea mexicana]
MAGYMPPLHVPLEPKWKHWPTYIYDKNYCYGINYYQPMLDYIDRNGRSSSLPPEPRVQRRREPPELPWSDGRALWEDRPVETYSRRELIKRAIDAEDEARDHLSQFKIANRSDFSLSKTAQASHVTREVFPRRLEEIKLKPLPLLVESARVRSQLRQIEREMADIDLQSLRDAQIMSEVQSALDHGKSLRGKSARAIEFQLRAEALKNLNKSQELADIRKYQRENAAANWAWETKEHVKLIEERTRNLLDEERLAAPLSSLSRELKGYEEKSSNYFLDKRYRHPTRPRRLYGCLGIRPA